mmetsp:Transcript_22964/g.72280  ORF Transcript_22964/g.72280 Transcript_22964/m.72280 type:complete len:211 (-) Transcript_22964:835-1467(-)
MKVALLVASHLWTQVSCIWTRSNTSGGISIGMLTWNTADMKMQSFLTAETQSVMRDAFEATKTNNYPPDLYAIAFQETKTSYCSADIKENKKDNDAFIDKMNPNPAEYRFVMQSWRNPNVLKNLRLGCKFTHGSSGVILFAKKSLSIENQGRFKSDDKLNNEKGFSAVWIKLKDKMICWGTSHSPPGKKLADKKRYPAFKKYSGFFRQLR